MDLSKLRMCILVRFLIAYLLSNGIKSREFMCVLRGRVRVEGVGSGEEEGRRE